MAATTEQRLRSNVTTLSAWLTGALLFVIGFGLLWWSGGIANVTWSSLVAQVGGVLVATGVLSIAWDLLGRRALAHEILAKAKLSTDLLESGVVSVELDFYKGPDWATLFTTSRQLDLFVSWGRTWRTNERSRIQELMRRGGRCRVFLPDPRDAATVATLAHRYSVPKEEVRRRIGAAVDDYRDIDSRIEVYLRKGEPLFTFYRFENVAVYAPYNHGGMRGKRMPVPAVVVEVGRFMEFVDQELKEVQEQSELAPTGKMEGMSELDYTNESHGGRPS